MIIILHIICNNVCIKYNKTDDKISQKFDKIFIYIN